MHASNHKNAEKLSSQGCSNAQASANSSACAMTFSVVSGTLPGGQRCFACSTLTIACILARADLRFCQLIEADLRSLSVRSKASSVSTAALGKRLSKAVERPKEAPHSLCCQPKRTFSQPLLPSNIFSCVFSVRFKSGMSGCFRPRAVRCGRRIGCGIQQVST